jgi:hypothetical protein
MVMSEVLQVVSQLVGAAEERVWAVERRLAFGEWCEKNIVISREENRDYSGPYRRDMVHSVVRIWEEFLDADDGRRWRELYATKGSQATFSSHALMAMCRHAVVSPSNVIYAIDTSTRAEEIARRWVAFFKNAEGCGKIVEGLAANALTGLAKELPGMMVWFAGAQSVGDLAMKQGVKLIIADEVDLHKTPKDDSRTLDLLKDRGKATAEFKLAAFCKPSTPDGQIWGPMEAGSQHWDFLPCPHCGFMQFLKPERMRYHHLTDHHGELDFGKVLSGTEYECESCGRGIEEKSKQEMMRHGEVRPTNFVKRTDEEGKEVMVPGWVPGQMSARINDLYSMFPGSTWGKLAMEKEKAKGDPMKLRAFVNGRCGDVWKEGTSRRVEVSDLMAMAKEGPEYARGGVVPFEVASVFCLADTQNDCWKATMMAFDHAGNAAVMDWGLFLGWDDLVEFAVSGVQVREGERKKCHICLVDEGGTRTWEVRRRCADLFPIFHPVKGAGGVQVTHSLKWRDFGLYKDGGEYGPKVQALVYDDPGFKYLLYKQMILGRKRLARDAGRLFFPRDLSEDYAGELASEHFEKTGGRWRWIVPAGAANDFGDTVKMGLIAWAEFGAIEGKVE